jgi:hypothetical protein
MRSIRFVRPEFSPQYMGNETIKTNEYFIDTIFRVELKREANHHGVEHKTIRQ